MIDITTIWPGWQIEELIGQGAYGKVYRIRKEELGSCYYAALKIIEIPADDAEVKNLMNMGMDGLSIRDYFEGTARNIANEIQIMESLKSAPNIVHVEEHTLRSHEEGIGWTILIRMELLESLRNYEARAGRPDVAETVKIGKDICSAIACCESKHIIHRDIKPENIFRSEFGSYKLGDFGIARQMENTKSAYSQKGTSAYMAPEVNRGDRYDNTVDIYSLGIMLYQYLNRQRMPFLPTDSNRITPQMMEEAQWRRLSGEELPAPCDAPPALAAVILKACSPDPSRRYRNANQFLAALENWENAKPESPVEPASAQEVAAPSHWASAGGSASSFGQFEPAGRQQLSPQPVWKDQETSVGSGTVPQTVSAGSEPPRTFSSASDNPTTFSASPKPSQTFTNVSDAPASFPTAPSGTDHAETGSQKNKLPLIIGAVAAVILIIVIAVSAGKKNGGESRSAEKETSVSQETVSTDTAEAEESADAAETDSTEASGTGKDNVSELSDTEALNLEIETRFPNGFSRNTFKFAVFDSEYYACGLDAVPAVERGAELAADVLAEMGVTVELVRPLPDEPIEEGLDYDSIVGIIGDVLTSEETVAMLEDADAIIGGGMSNICMAYEEYYYEMPDEGILFFSPATYFESISYAGVPMNYMAGSVMSIAEGVAAAMEKQGCTNVLIASGETNYNREFRELLQNELNVRGISNSVEEIPIDMAYTNGMETLGTISNLDEYDAVFLSGISGPANFVDTLTYMGYDPEKIALYGDENVVDLDPELTRGMYIVTADYLTEQSDLATIFRNRYKAVYGEEPTTFSYYAYESVFQLVEAAQAAGLSGEDHSYNDWLDAFIDAPALPSMFGNVSWEGGVTRIAVPEYHILINEGDGYRRVD